MQRRKVATVCAPLEPDIEVRQLRRVRDESTEACYDVRAIISAISRNRDLAHVGELFQFQRGRGCAAEGYSQDLEKRQGYERVHNHNLRPFRIVDTNMPPTPTLNELTAITHNKYAPHFLDLAQRRDSLTQIGENTLVRLMRLRQRAPTPRPRSPGAFHRTRS